MKIQLPNTTPSCLRTLRRLSVSSGTDQILPADLVAAILAEESLGGRVLRQLGFEQKTVHVGEVVDDGATNELRDYPDPCDNGQRAILEFHGGEWLEPLLERAALLSRRTDAAGAVTTQLLVRAMSQLPGPGRRYLATHNVLEEDVERFLDDEPPAIAGTVPVNFAFDELDSGEAEQQSESLTVTASHDSQSRIFAAIDANLNRAREGLRVLDDFARFVRRDAKVMETAKRMRHELVNAEQTLRRSERFIDSRDVEEDPGTGITLASEESRDGLTALIQSNARRVQEALRSLEEFGKLIDVSFAAAAKQLRYHAYVLEQQLLSQQDSVRTKLLASQLYVLITEASCRLPWKTVVEQVIAGGADILQLREKQLSDEAFVRRASWIASACRESGTLLIVNDRVTLAEQCQADGVHIGQDDSSVQQARSIVGPDLLIGLSTHNPDQLESANKTTADYVGAGPVFPSETKQFENFAGVSYAQHAATHSRTPSFAIGGISEDRMPELIAAEVGRIAVCGAIIGSDRPRAVTSVFAQALATTEPSVID